MPMTKKSICLCRHQVEGLPLLLLLPPIVAAAAAAVAAYVGLTLRYSSARRQDS